MPQVSTAVQASRAMQSVVGHHSSPSPRASSLSAALREGEGRVIAASPPQVVLASEASLRDEEHRCLKAAIELLDKQRAFVPQLLNSLHVMENLVQRVDTLEAKLVDLELQAKNVDLNSTLDQGFGSAI